MLYDNQEDWENEEIVILDGLKFDQVDILKKL